MIIYRLKPHLDGLSLIFRPYTNRIWAYIASFNLFLAVQMGCLFIKQIDINYARSI